MSIVTKKNILITSLLLETKSFLTVGELVICCSLNKQNQRDISEIWKYVKRSMSMNFSSLIEEKEMFVWLKLTNKILYDCRIDEVAGYDLEHYDVEPGEWTIEDYNFAVKHFDFMKSRKKLYPLLCLVQLYSVIIKNSRDVDNKLIPDANRIEEIINFSKNSHTDIFNEVKDIFFDEQNFNRRIRTDNTGLDMYDFVLITILCNITLKINGYNYLPVEFSESL